MKKRNKAYFVSTFTDESDVLKRRHRTPGFFFDLKDAIATAKYNYGDIQEHFYVWLLIEPIREGLYGGVGLGTQNRLWYKWNYETSRWNKSKNPPAWSYIYWGFAIG